MNSEGDFIGALRHLVIPIALEYQPEIVFVALGFDCAYYDDLLENGQGMKAHGLVLKRFNRFDGTLSLFTSFTWLSLYKD